MKTPMPKSKAWKTELRSRLSVFSNLIFAGLVKNAGKTTALNAVNDLFEDRTLGLTSIGYDGEAQDAIYHHPKPPISVRPGQLVLTAERFLSATTRGYEILDSWGHHPQFGAWLILRITAPGDIRMAGPSSLSELHEGISRLRNFGATQIHVDGALNRLSHISLDSTLQFKAKTVYGAPSEMADRFKKPPSSGLAQELEITNNLEFLSSGIILSTGAALGNTLKEVAERTQYSLELFELPAYSASIGSPFNPPQLDVPVNNNSFFCQGKWFPLPSSPWNQDLKSLLPSQVEILYLKGALTDSIYFALRAAGRLPQELIIRTPAHILLSPKVWSGLKFRGIRVKVLERPNLLLLTLSPWHPLTPIPTELLAEALLPLVKVPLIDIHKQHLWIP